VRGKVTASDAAIERYRNGLAILRLDPFADIEAASLPSRDHRGIKGRYQPMRGFKRGSCAARFCRGYDELRNFLRSRSNRNQPVPANHHRLHILSRCLTVLSVLQAA
jgi:hypothetical protein